MENRDGRLMSPFLDWSFKHFICQDKNGERYLIEMQNQEAQNVKERIIYYTCRMIDRIGFRGSKWNYKDIKKAYTTCMMNFTYESNPV